MRVDPVIKMGGGFGLPRFFDQGVTLGTRWKLGGLVARLLSEAGKAVFERLLETTPLLHSAAPAFEEAGAQLAFSSPVLAMGLTVLAKVCARKLPRASAKTQLFARNKYEINIG
jgi:hypothetical protein